MNGNLPVPAEPVYDGELVDVRPVVPRRTLGHRFADWWRHSPRIPVALKSWHVAGHAAMEAFRWLLRSPVRFVGAVARGVVVAIRAWRRWVRVHDYRQAAEQSEKLADKFVEIRALTLFRWKVTGITAVVVLAVLAIAYLVYGDVALWIAAGIAATALAIAGRRKDGSPGRRAVLAGPRALTWTMDPQVLVDAFRDAKLIGKDESLRLVDHGRSAGHPQGRRCDQAPGCVGLRAGRR